MSHTVALVVLAALGSPQATRGPHGVRRINPPESGFFAKRLDYRGIPIKASEAVSDDALLEAKRRLRRMLARIPGAAANLASAGAELHIIGRDQVTSDLPEFRALKGKPFDGNLTVDERTRGLGGLLCSCGEENLLRLPADRYAGRDICTHEFAHALLDYALSPEFRERWREQYERSKACGLWTGAYAATNPGEFFAELSMWYFGTHGDYGKIEPTPADGREWLRSYDVGAFRLMDDLYSGRIRTPRISPPARSLRQKSVGAAHQR